MDIYSTDDEQLERIKKWVKEYAPTVIISILIVVVATFGWRYWMQRVNNVRADASNTYEQLLSNAMNNGAGIQEQAQNLIKKYSSTPYAKLAALLLAKEEIQSGDMAGAQKELNWVIQESDVDSIKQIARDRLARLLISENKADQAIEILKTVNDKAFLTAIDAIRGDAYVAIGNTEMARKSYQAALAILPAVDDNRPLLVMKLNDLPA